MSVVPVAGKATIAVVGRSSTCIGCVAFGSTVNRDTDRRAGAERAGDGVALPMNVAAAGACVNGVSWLVGAVGLGIVCVVEDCASPVG